MSKKIHLMQKFQPVLEQLRLESKANLQNAFGDVSEYGFTVETFLYLLTSKLSLAVEENDVKHLFFQIDRYSKNKITLKKLTDYIECYETRRADQDDGPFIPTPVLYPGMRCQDSIIEWTLYPEIEDVHDEVSSHFVSLSRSGHLAIWSRDLKKRFEGSIEVVDDAGKMITWATALVIFPREKLLAISTTSGDIRFFRSSTYKFEHKFSIVSLPSTLFRLHSHDSNRLVCGDFEGSVYTIHFASSFFQRIRRRAAHLGSENIMLENIRKGRVTGLSLEGTTKAHFSPVQKVAYYPQLVAIVSCAASTKRAMLIHYPEHNESLSFSSSGGIFCFAYCEKLNCVITGGIDHAIKIWNPTVNTSYNESLNGHTCPVNHVLVNEKDLFLISADQENNIRIWDLLHPNCLQHVKSNIPVRHSFASVFFDSETGKLILTTHRIAVLEIRPIIARKKTHPESELIVFAGYVGIFDCIVTVGSGATVGLWDFKSGKLIYEFQNAHEALDADGFPIQYSITAAGLDPSKRRLITTDRMGNVKVWNYHLGICLRHFETKITVLALSFVGFHVYVSGTSGEIVDLYDNDEDETKATVWDSIHETTVVSIDCYRRSLLASASCDGKIVVWLRKSAKSKFELRDFKKDDSEEVDEKFLAKSIVDERRQCSVSQVLFLQNREMDSFVGNLVSCGSDGKIRFWNILCTSKVNKGQLTSKFRGVDRDCDYVICMATDDKNNVLVTGDTLGFIRVYDLDNYYSSYGSVPRTELEYCPEQEKRFPFRRLKRLVNQNFPHLSKSRDDCSVGNVPFLLNRFRAHLGPVLQVNYSDRNDLLITAGREGSVRLWTLAGEYIGCLGPTDEEWGLRKATTKPANMPADIRAVASPYTLCAINSGATPLWSRAIVALRRCRMGQQPEDTAEEPFQWKTKKFPPQGEKEMKENLNLGAELSKRLRQSTVMHCSKGEFPHGYMETNL